VSFVNNIADHTGWSHSADNHVWVDDVKVEGVGSVSSVQLRFEKDCSLDPSADGAPHGKRAAFMADASTASTNNMRGTIFSLDNCPSERWLLGTKNADCSSALACGKATLCTDQTVFGDPAHGVGATNPFCRCVGVNYHDTLTAISNGRDPALAPYNAGCLIPLSLEEVSYKSASVEVDILKTRTLAPVVEENVTTVVTGTDWLSSEYIILVDTSESAFWLSSSSTATVQNDGAQALVVVSVQINSTGMAEALDEYSSEFSVHLLSAALDWKLGDPVPTQGVVRTLSVPVVVLVTATAVAATSTLEAADGVTAVVRSSYVYHIQARDVDGLPVVRIGPIFHAYLSTGSSEVKQSQSATFVGDGLYEVVVLLPSTRGFATIRTVLTNLTGYEEQVGGLLHLNISCPVASEVTGTGTLPSASVPLPDGTCGCRAGLVPTASDSTTCQPCSPGYTSTVGSPNCDIICPPSTFALRGDPACTPCAAGTFQSNYGRDSCTQCASGTFAPTGSSACTDSRTGLQVTDGSVNGSAAGQLNGTLPGYWTYAPIVCTSNDAADLRGIAPTDTCNALPVTEGGLEIWPCETSEWCLGGPNSTCLEGHVGVLCEECQKYWYLDNGFCAPCEEQNDNADSFSTQFVALVLFSIGGLCFSTLFVLLLCVCTKEPIDSLAEVEEKLRKLQAEKAACSDASTVARLDREQSRVMSRAMWSVNDESFIHETRPHHQESRRETDLTFGRASMESVRSDEKQRNSAYNDPRYMATDVTTVAVGEYIALTQQLQAADIASSAAADQVATDAATVAGQTAISSAAASAGADQLTNAAGDVSGVAGQAATHAAEGVTGAANDCASGMGDAAGGVGDAADGVAELGAAGTAIADGAAEVGDAVASLAESGSTAAREAYTVAYDMMGFSQVTSALTEAMPTVQWPISFSSITDVFKSVSLDFVNSWGALECQLHSNYCQKTLLIMVAFGVFALGVPLCGWVLRTRVLRPRLKWSERRLEVLADRQIRLNLVIFTIVHAPLTMRLLKNLNCQSYGDLNVLVTDKSINCSSSDWTICAVTSAVFLCIYTIGIPALLLGILIRYQSPIADSRIAALPISGDARDKLKRRWKERAAFFRRKYEECYWYWELIEISRKMILSGLVIFLYPGTATQPLIALLITLVFLLLTTRHAPFKLTSIDILSVVTQCCTALTLLFALASKTTILEELSLSADFIDRALVFLMVIPIVVSIVIIGHTLHWVRKTMKERRNYAESGLLKNQLATQHLKQKEASMKRRRERPPALKPWRTTSSFVHNKVVATPLQPWMTALQVSMWKQGRGSSTKVDGVKTVPRDSMRKGHETGDEESASTNSANESLEAVLANLKASGEQDPEERLRKINEIIDSRHKPARPKSNSAARRVAPPEPVQPSAQAHEAYFDPDDTFGDEEIVAPSEDVTVTPEYTHPSFVRSPVRAGDDGSSAPTLNARSQPVVPFGVRLNNGRPARSLIV